jgi:hypothetical protein
MGVVVSDNYDEFAVAPGWYPDPADSARLRRWDGQGWTTDVVPVDAFAADQVPQPAEPEPEPEPLPEPEPQPAPTPQPEPDPAPRAAPQHDSSDPDLSIWATLPGLTLPPDLSSIPGMSPKPALPMPEFDQPAREMPPGPTDPVFTEPVFTEPVVIEPVVIEATFTDPLAEPTDSEAADSVPPTSTDSGGAETRRTRRQMRDSRAPADDLRDTDEVPTHPGRAPSAPYAPPPAGVQYIAPLPPGVASVEPAPNAYPASSFGNRITPSWTDSKAVDSPDVPPVGAAPTAPSPFPATPLSPSAAPLPPTQPQVDPAARVARPMGVPEPTGSSTLGVWLIAILPLLQFAAIYYAFGLLAQPLLPGVQWGVLLAPAVFSLIFAALDGRKLREQGHDRVPSTLWAIIPPLYLFVRCFRIGPRSISALLLWLIFQAAAVAGIYLLLPDVLAEAMGTVALTAAVVSTAATMTEQK